MVCEARPEVHRKSGLPDLRRSMRAHLGQARGPPQVVVYPTCGTQGVRTSGEPEVRCHPRLINKAVNAGTADKFTQSAQADCVAGRDEERIFADAYWLSVRATRMPMFEPRVTAGLCSR